jgi:hypothetical protein
MAITRQCAPCPSCGMRFSDYVHALYPLLVAHADDFGRLTGDALTVQLQVDPTSGHSDADVERAIGILAAAELVIWYDDKRRQRALSIVDFEEHQTLRRQTTSKYTAPDPHPETLGRSRSPSHAGKRAHPPASASDREQAPAFASVVRPREVKRSEEKRSEEEHKYADPPSAQPVEKSERTNKNAPAAPARLNGSRKSKPSVKVLAAMVLRDVLPLRVHPDDLNDVAKARAAKLHLAYDSRSIASAIESAQAQAKKAKHA